MRQSEATPLSPEVDTRPISPDTDAAQGPFRIPWVTRDALTRSLLVLALATIAYLFVQIVMYRYGRDQGIYATVADTMLRGGMPYRDAWDFKPPGIFMIYAFARAIFGRGEWGIRVVEIGGLASAVWAFTILARRFFGDWRIGIFGGVLAVIVHGELEFWHTAQPESFGGVLTAWALVLATFEPSKASTFAGGRTKQLAAWAGAGALYGFTFLLKPPLAGGALASASFAAWRIAKDAPPSPLITRLRQMAAPVLVMGAGSVAVIALCAAWFAARGALGDLYQTLFVFTPHYTKLSWVGGTIPGMVYLALEEWFVDLSSPNCAGLIAAFILLPRAKREHEGVWHLLAVVGIQLAGVAMQAKFFPYHYGASLVVGSLIAGLGVCKLWERALARGWFAVAAFSALLPVVFYARSATRNTQTDYWERCVERHRLLLGLSSETRDELDGKLYSVADVSYDANRRVAEVLREHLAPNELAFIWGFEPIIYDMAERRSATRFLYNVPQRVAWSKDEARAQLMADLDAHPPKAIVVERRDVFPAVTGDAIDSADTLKQFPALNARLHERYALFTTIEDFEIYLEN